MGVILHNYEPAHFSLVFRVYIQIEDMVEELKEAFYHALKRNNWMDERTRRYALRKVGYSYSLNTYASQRPRVLEKQVLETI